MATQTKARAAARTTRCSFCGKAADDVQKLIAGPGVFICNECVQLCTDILRTQPAGRTSSVPWAETLSDEELLHHVGRVAAASAQVDESLQLWVDTLRERGVTWVRIGAALGMTRQSAWERFSGEE